MFDSNRLLNNAIGIALAAAFSGCVFMIGLTHGRDQEAARSQAQAEQQTSPSTGAALLNQVPAPATDDGTEYNYYSAEDLQAQRDMARWAFIQLIVSAGGLFLLIRTLRYTADATLAAAQAAKAAQASLKLAETELYELRRPYIVVSITSFDLWDSDQAKISFRLSNIGELPAEIISFQSELVEHEPGSKEGRYPAENLLEGFRGGQVIAAQTGVVDALYVRPQRFSPEHKYDFSESQRLFFFRGEFTYSDPSGSKRDAGFNFFFQPLAKQWFSETDSVRLSFDARPQRADTGNFDRKQGEQPE